MSLLMENAHAKIGCGDPGDPIEFAALFDGGHLSWSPSVNGNAGIWSVSFWVKRTRSLSGGAQDMVFSYGSSTPGIMRMYYALERLSLVDSESGDGLRNTTALYRDFSNYVHVYVEFDNTAPLAENRMRLWVRGIEVTDFNIENVYVFNKALRVMQAGQEQRIGFGNSQTGLLYLADYIHRDGIVGTGPEPFGRFNSVGDWVNKSFSGKGQAAVAYGVNGFHLDFADLADLGKDVSGNGNHFSVSGAVSQVSDAPGLGNFATLNPALPFDPKQGNYSYGNLKSSAVYLSLNSSGYATLPIHKDKPSYFTVKADVFGTRLALGVSSDLSTRIVSTTDAIWLEDDTTLSVFGAISSYSSGFTTEEVGAYTDPAAETIEFFINGVPQGAISAPELFGETLFYFGFFTDDVNSPTVEVNFGQNPWGYAPPSNASLSTGSVSCPEILDPAKYYQREQTIGGGDLSTSWNPLIDDTLVLTNRTDSAEEWRVNMIIGGVQVNPFDTADNLGEIVGEDGFTFNSGGAAVGADVNYQGTRIDRAFRCTAQSGMALVTINHVNGVPTVVNHSAGGVADEATFFPVSGGDRREYLRSQGGDGYRRLNGIEFTPDPGFISGNMVNQFTVDGSLPTGTYRVWIKRSVPQFSKSYVYEGNNDPADGSFVPLDFEADLFMGRKLSGGSNYFVKDNLGSNPNVQNQFLNSISSPGVDTWGMDFYSNGVKWFDASQSTNDSGLYAGFAIAKTPIKFANAV